MSFIGAIPTPLRKIFASYAGEIKTPVLLPCGGNFTIGSALRSGGYTGRMTSCDITLYSCGLGSYLSGARLEVCEAADCPEYLRGLLDCSDPGRLAASLSLLLDLNQVWKNKNIWHARTLANARSNWSNLMERTLARLSMFKAHMTKGEGFGFASQDMLKFLENQDRNQSLLIYPPTYGTRGYIRLDKVLNVCSTWDAPCFTEINFESREIYEILTSFRQWFIVMEKILPELEPLLGQPVAVVHKGRNSVCYIHAGSARKSYITRAYLNSDSPGPIFPSDKPLSGSEEPGIALLSYRQSIRLSELFMSSRVDYSHASFLLSVAFCLERQIIGKADFKLSKAPWKLPMPGLQIYQLSDLAVPSTATRRLAKLVLLFIQSHELKQLLQEKLPEEWVYATTTAFSDHPVSMKYRGIYKLHKRLESEGVEKYRLNYYAPLGQWSLTEAFARWRQKFQ